MAKTPVLNNLARKKKTHERLRELWCLFECFCILSLQITEVLTGQFTDLK